MPWMSQVDLTTDGEDGAVAWTSLTRSRGASSAQARHGVTAGEESNSDSDEDDIFSMGVPGKAHAANAPKTTKKVSSLAALVETLTPDAFLGTSSFV